MNASRLALVVLALAWATGNAQSSASSKSDDSKPDVTVRLEAHDGQTRFKIGERVLVDLVFTSLTNAYTVETDDNPYLSVRDLINIVPDGGWFRSHVALLGQPLNGNASVKLTGNPVRVPILLNRAISFQKPGHYEVTIMTQRLFPTEWSSAKPSSNECDRCRTTNPLGIEIDEFDASEEPSLVVSLTRTLKETTPHGVPEVLTAEEKEAFDRQMEDAKSEAGSAEERNRKTDAMMQKMGEIGQKQQSLMQKRELARREAAERLACLPGDDALRAKVRFIAAATDNGDPDPVAFILVNGLPSSHNLELQLTLLKQAWHDPQHAPTLILQSALRQARELVRIGSVTDDQLVYAGTSEERKAAQEAYQSDLKEIVSTLPLRTVENRDRTIDFLKKAGIADPLNQQQTAAQ